MNTFFYISLFIFGTIFGSFASVIIYRLKSGEKGILTGRSHCPTCRKILGALDLIPVFSWIINMGKCRYCKKKVSSIYVLLEICMGLLFSLIGYFLIDFSLIIEGNFPEIMKLCFWLIIGFVSVVYTFYDLLFLEIPEKVLAVGIGFSITYIGIKTLIVTNSLIIGFSAIMLSVIIIGLLYIIMLKELKSIYDILILTICAGLLFIFKYIFDINLSNIPILSGIIGALGIFIFFFLQIFVSKGKWMGGGDLRIAILMGLILGISLSFYGTIISYFTGSMIGIGIILFSKVKNGLRQKLDTQVPFGPFLAIGFFITIFFSEYILEFGENFLYL